MRTTLTLDDDVAAMLSRARKQRQAGLKETVNSALRQGLPRLLEAPAARKKFATSPVIQGRCLLPNLDNIAEVLETIEGPWYK
jgi:hypothetical protein